MSEENKFKSSMKDIVINCTVHEAMHDSEVALGIVLIPLIPDVASPLGSVFYRNCLFRLFVHWSQSIISLA